MLSYLLVGLGGGVGAMARFGVGGLAHRWAGALPLGTLMVNVLGCLVVGAIAGLSLDRAAMTPGVRLLVVTGFLGGFTTFSAFGAETFALAREGRTGMAAMNIAANVVLSLGAVWVGFGAVRAAAS